MTTMRPTKFRMPELRAAKSARNPSTKTLQHTFLQMCVCGAFVCATPRATSAIDAIRFGIACRHTHLMRSSAARSLDTPTAHIYRQTHLAAPTMALAVFRTSTIITPALRWETSPRGVLVAIPIIGLITQRNRIRCWCVGGC